MMAALAARMDAPVERRLHIVQGEQCVSDDPGVVMSTLLGSCVAACMRDPIAGVGGMNHFLLPGENARKLGAESLRHGVHAMELLVNALLSQGARRDRLEAKLFGGANLMKGLTDVGAMNATFAEDFLKQEGIANVGGDLRGQRGRRIQFWPISGRARQVLLAADERNLVREDRSTPAVASASGMLELF